MTENNVPAIPEKNIERDMVSALDLVVYHHADNRVRYEDAIGITIPADHDEEIYILTDLIRSALLSRIKTNGGTLPVTRWGDESLIANDSWFESEQPIRAGDLRQVIPQMIKSVDLHGLIRQIRERGSEQWVIYPRELLNVVDPNYIASSLGAASLVWSAAHVPYPPSADYLVDQAVEILIRLWIKDHAVKPQEYAKWRVQGKAAIRSRLKDAIEKGSLDGLKIIPSNNE